VIDTVKGSLEAMGSHGLFGISARNTAERIGIAAGHEVITEARAGSRAALKAEISKIDSTMARSGFADYSRAADGKAPLPPRPKRGSVLRKNRARAAYSQANRQGMANARLAQSEAYDKAYRLTKTRNRTGLFLGGLGVANGRSKTHNNQSTYAARGMRNGGIGYSSGAMQRHDYGNRSSGAYA